MDQYKQYMKMEKHKNKKKKINIYSLVHFYFSNFNIISSFKI